MKKINALYDIDEDQTDKNRVAIWYRFISNNERSCPILTILGTTMLLCRRSRSLGCIRILQAWSWFVPPFYSAQMMVYKCLLTARNQEIQGTKPPPLTTDSVRYWSDFNTLYYHPRSIVQLHQYAVNSTVSPFENYTGGQELFNSIDKVCFSRTYVPIY